MHETPAQILMIEDSESDIRLAKIALERAKLLNVLEVARDGEEALRYLHKQTPFENAKRPDLILLDLNLPKIDGHEVLQRIRADESLKSIPVVMLTSSEADADILKSYRLSANCYITKPVSLTKFVDIVDSLENFWVKVVRLPRE